MEPGKENKVVVIGSNSFSGAHFVDLLLGSKMKVVGISRSQEYNQVFLPYKWGDNQNSKFSFYQYDLNLDFEKIIENISLFEPDYIVNYAAEGMVAPSWENPDQWFETNTMSCVRLQNRIKDCSFLKKYVHISTPEVYGSCKGYVKENVNYNPSTPYAASKAAADMHLMASYNNSGFPVIFTRSANVYGQGQQLYRIVPKAILFFLLNKTLELHGGGHSVRSFIHIEDVCKGTVKAMLTAPPGSIYHFATKEAISIRSLVKLIADKIGVSFSKLVKTTGERPGKDQEYLIDCSLAQKELKWESEILLEQGIDDTIEWIERNIDILKKEPFDYIHKH